MTLYMPRSAALVYDDLAIAAIKVSHNPDNEEAKAILMELDNAIQQQVGVMHHEQVCASVEYLNLLKVNDEMYVVIDALNEKGEMHGIATYINDRVHRRYLAKVALQKAWFPGVGLGEIKFGYTK